MFGMQNGDLMTEEELLTILKENGGIPRVESEERFDVLLNILGWNHVVETNSVVN